MESDRDASYNEASRVVLKNKEFIKTVSIDGNDRLRIRIGTEKGQVVNVMVQYEANITGAWCEIVRYDCAHGFLHQQI